MASCENKYTTLLDLSRQAKIITGETACFNGKIEAGIPFSGYPTGVDTGSTVSLGVVSSETAVFSGNTGTTIFDVSNTGSTNYDAIFSGYSGTVWTNALFSGNTSGLTLPITPLSANTQIVGPFWTLTQTGMTGDYVIGTQYTGYSITYSFSQTQQLGFVTGFTAYSGLTSASQENFSAGTLDYKGPLDYISSVEDATIDGRLTTDRLTVTGGASLGTLGYVLTQTGNTGEVGWLFNSASASTQFTGNTSGTCITDLYLRNLYGCSPLHIEPSGVNDVYIVENGGNVGIGTTTTPTEKLHVSDGDILVENDSGKFYSDLGFSSGPALRLSGSPSDLTTFGVNTSGFSGNEGMSIGVRGLSESSFPGYGKQGDGFLYSSVEQNGLNIISPQGTNKDDYIRFYAGQDANGTTPDIHIQGSGSTRGYVGIGTTLPTEKLHVAAGNVRIDKLGLLEIYDDNNNITQLLQTNTTPTNSFGSLQFNRNSTGFESAFIANYAPSGNTIFRCGDNGSDTDDVMVLYGSGNTIGNNQLIFSGDSEPLIFGNGNLEVFGNIGIKQLPTGTPFKDVSIDATGKLTDNTSDERLKENVLTLNNSLSKLLQLSGVSYNWINREDSGNDRFYGFIAQQLEKVDNHLTFTSKSSGYMGVRNDAITPLIVESIKEIHNNPSIPNYTPTSSNDSYGNIGNVTSDDDYLYVKTNNGWKRTSLESF